MFYIFNKREAFYAAVDDTTTDYIGSFDEATLLLQIKQRIVEFIVAQKERFFYKNDLF